MKKESEGDYMEKTPLPSGVALVFEDYCKSCNECEIEISKGICNTTFISCVHENACERIYKMKGDARNEGN